MSGRKKGRAPQSAVANKPADEQGVAGKSAAWWRERAAKLRAVLTARPEFKIPARGLVPLPHLLRPRCRCIRHHDLSDLPGGDESSRCSQDQDRQSHAGKSSPWWCDGSQFHELLYASGTTPVREVIANLDGCTGGKAGETGLVRAPIAIPRQSWASLDEARRGAESYALMAMPLESVDPKIAARIKRENSTPHPMGPLLNRQPSQGATSDWKPTSGDATAMPDLPDFLRRRELARWESKQ